LHQSPERDERPGDLQKDESLLALGIGKNPQGGRPDEVREQERPGPRVPERATTGLVRLGPFYGSDRDHLEPGPGVEWLHLQHDLRRREGALSRGGPEPSSCPRKRELEKGASTDGGCVLGAGVPGVHHLDLTIVGSVTVRARSSSSC
jgi:hypothetical protein